MSGGYRAYLRNILPRLAAHPEVEAILCAAPAQLKIESWFPALRKVNFIPCSPFRFMHHRPDASLKRMVEKFSPDVIFIPVERYCNFGKFSLVTMVQNMGPMIPIQGNPLRERLRYIAQRYEAKIAVRMSTRVIVPTIFVRDFLTERWNIPRERVSVIHYGSTTTLNEGTFHNPALVPKEWAGRFIFTAGSVEPYRGLEDILCAFSMVQDRGIAGIVIAGEVRKNMRGYYKKLQSWIVRHGLGDKILWAGHLDEQEMSWCYRNSCVFAMTSRVESLSIIGLEALAHGCICIVANSPPLPEIFGEAALYYPPTDGKALAESIQSVLRFNTTKQTEISERARQRAATFSWDKTVEKALKAFKEII